MIEGKGTGLHSFPVPIPLCKNNLNMPMCSSFFLPCGWLSSPLVHYVVMLATLLRCADFLFCFVFTEADFVAQP